MSKLEFNTILEIEDLFAPAFTNGFDGRNVSMDSYMAVMSYDIVDSIFYNIFPYYSMETWNSIVEYWSYMAYCSPMCGLLSNTIKRKLEQINYG